MTRDFVVQWFLTFNQFVKNESFMWELTLNILEIINLRKFCNIEVQVCPTSYPIVLDLYTEYFDIIRLCGFMSFWKPKLQKWCHFKNITRNFRKRVKGLSCQVPDPSGNNTCSSLYLEPNIINAF